MHAAALVLGQEARGLRGWELGLAAGVTVFVTILALAFLFAFFRHIGQGSLMEGTIRRWIEELRPFPDTVAAVIDEFIARRYEFLTFYGQFIITTLVIAAITVLLLAGVIESDAGLPVLATILGIVLGKTVLTRRALPERPAEEEEEMPESDRLPEPPGPSAAPAHGGQ
jgi:hypothetical protein